MYYLLLLLLLVLLLVISVFKFNCEILAPPVIMTLMFVFAGFLGLVKWNDWRVYEYGAYSVFVLISGVASFILSSFLVRELFVRSGVESKEKTIMKRVRIEINSLVLFLFLLFGVLCNAILFITMRRIVGQLGFSTTSVPVIINHFRNITSIEYFADKYSIPIYVKMLIWIITSVGIFSLFVFFHNVLFCTYKKKDSILVAVVILWLLAMLLNSHRSYVLTALSIVIYLAYFFQNMKNEWNPVVSRKILVVGIRLFIVMLVSFIGMAVLLGRYSSINDIDIFNYVAKYISSGIRNFDLFIKNPPPQRAFGGESFASLYRSINNILGLGNYVATELEFTTVNGKVLTNIYTAFRRYYSDFGYFGMIVLSALMGGAFTYNYECIKNRSRYGIIDFSMLLFLYFCKGIFQMCIEETILDFEVSLNGLFKIILLYLLYYCFVKNRIRVQIK